MAVARINRDLLQTFVPLNALSAERLDYLLEGQQLETLAPGTEICRRGESDGYTVYLLSGSVTLEGEGGSVQALDASDLEASHALAPEQPRQATVRARTAVNILRFESKRLDRVLAWDQSTESLQKELAALHPGENSDWIARLLQSRLFYRLPPANVVDLFKRLKAQPVAAGEVIIRRGDEADCCYIIKSGVAEVTIPGDSGPVTLALLEKGQYFGEEGLLIEGTRNADITMNTDGVLMRLDKADFDTLLKAPSLAMVDFTAAMTAVEQGEAQWLDVRLAEEQERGVLTGAVCLPLQALRVKSRLLPKERRYVVYCDTGRRSAAAAFLLGVMGYDTQILEGGLWSLMRAERDRYLVRPGGGD
ncbi:MAG TPA: cyclic nucleotide-binding domain-containing protein [Moraxellaceae bacterium]|nr:cyclic nucleotide-binding domain-containing protein [Moraxellaceae bacterium]